MKLVYFASFKVASYQVTANKVICKIKSELLPIVYWTVQFQPCLDNLQPVRINKIDEFLTGQFVFISLVATWCHWILISVYFGIRSVGQRSWAFKRSRIYNWNQWRQRRLRKIQRGIKPFDFGRTRLGELLTEADRRICTKHPWSVRFTLTPMKCFDALRRVHEFARWELANRILIRLKVLPRQSRS